MALPLTHLQHQLQVGREMSLLGDYSSASEYFKGVAAAMTKYMGGLNDPYLKSQWSKAKKAVQEELDSVREIEKITAAFARPGSSAYAANVISAGNPAPQLRQRDIPVSVITAADRRAHNFEAQEPEDPDVWRPPTRGPPSYISSRPRSGQYNEEPKLPAWAQKGQGDAAARRGVRANAGPSFTKDVKSRVDSRRPAAGGKGKEKEKEKEKSKYEGPDMELASKLETDMLEKSPGVHWSSIAGLEDAKQVLEEAVVWPLWRPEMFTGIRRPPKGVLLFGPPGTGKTLLAKAIATDCNTTFFNISAASLASKFRGESERMVRVLFQLARAHAPSTIFIDEIDSLCSSRGEGGEHEASRRVKTEMLVQIDGCNSGGEEGEPAPYVMVLAATNYPWDLDEALRRRMEKRIYIGLPDRNQREELLKINLKNETAAPDVDLAELARQTEGFSGDDCSNICRDAATHVVRRVMSGKTREEIKALDSAQKEPVRMDDFVQALAKRSPSVSTEDVRKHEGWRDKFGAN